MMQISIDGTQVDSDAGDRLIDKIQRAGISLPQVCYHPQLGPVQTCDTCIVDVNGALVRACGTVVAAGMKVSTTALQWPVAADGSDQPLLYTKGFAFPDGKARLFPLAWREPTESPDSEFDLHLNNGRLLEHFHEGNLTYRSPGIQSKTPDTFVEVSPELAGVRGIQSGSLVQLTSRHGRVRVRALVTDRVRNGELYMPMNSSSSPVNLLTGSHTDPTTHTPAYKETAVNMQVLAVAGESPLPRTNSRFGHPTPQNGVGVERKWQQPGYRFPGKQEK